MRCRTRDAVASRAEALFRGATRHSDKPASRRAKRNATSLSKERPARDHGAGAALARCNCVAQIYSSNPESSRYPEPPQSVVNPDELLDELGAQSVGVNSEPAPQSRALHFHAELPGGREATHRRVLTRSKLPLDVGQHTYIGGTGAYRGQTFDSSTPGSLKEKLGSALAHVSSKVSTATKVVGTVRLGRLLLTKPYVGVPVLLLAGGAWFWGRRKR